jgi:hypothetical protein
MFCCAGNVIQIRPDGMVRQGVCQSYDVSFNIFTEEFPENFFDPVICRINRCSCTANHFVPKFINPMDAPQYLNDKQLLNAVNNYLHFKRKEDTRKIAINSGLNIEIQNLKYALDIANKKLEQLREGKDRLP